MNKYIIADQDAKRVSIISEIVAKNDAGAVIHSTLKSSEVTELVLHERPDFVFIRAKSTNPDSISICKTLRENFAGNIRIILISTPKEKQKLKNDILQTDADSLFAFPLDETAFSLQLKSWLKEKNKTTSDKSGSVTNYDDEEALESLVAREEKYRAVFENLIDGILVVNSEGLIIEVNKNIKTITGFKKKDCINMPFWDFLYQLTPVKEHSQRDYDLLKGYLKQILAEKDSRSFGKLAEQQIIRTDGQVRFIETVFYPIFSNGNHFMAALFRDITQRKLFEEAIKTSESKYHGIFDANKDGISIFFLNPDNTVSNFIEANKAAYETIGYTKQEFLSMNIFDLELSDTPDFVSKILNKLRKKSFLNLETTVRNKNGDLLHVDLHIQTIKYNNRLAIMNILRDITSRKEVESALKESEERFKMLFQKAPVGYQSLDQNGRLIEVNETWLEMMGYKKEEVIGCYFGDFVVSDFAEIYNHQFYNLRNEKQVNSELELYKKNRKIIRIQIRGFAGHIPNETTFQIHCVLTDITELHQASKEIADEQILLRTLIDNIPDMVYVKDTLGRKLISNKADLAILELTNEKKVIGKTDLELFDKDTAWRTYNDDLMVVSLAKPIINKHETFIGSDGTKRIISTTKIPLASESGEIIGLVGVGRDITKEKLSEQKITQLSQGIEQSPSSIIITDTSGNIEYANPKVEEKTGYKISEILGKNPRIFQSGYTSPKEYSRLWATIKAGKEYHGEIQNRKKNGEIYWESVLISPLRDETGKIINFIAIKEDITSRKKYELELQKMRVAIEQSPASVIITDTEGIIEYVNKKFVTTTGYPADELTGRTVRILKPGHLDDDSFVDLWNCLYSGKEWRGEHLNRTKQNVKYWESVLISPVKNQEGEITNYIILSEDISGRKKMEHDLIKAKEKAEESDRLKSAFLANMSHEIRTPLNSILGFSDLLSDQYLNAETRMEYAGLINSSGGNLLAIINDVLDISKIEAGQIALSEGLFSAKELISEIMREYIHKAKTKGLDFRIRMPESNQNIMICSDEVRIKQVLINFVGNALKFTDSGYIEIGVAQKNETIQFHVKDTGIGIPKEYHAKIFDRFRQVEGAKTRKYSGNGLGLAITKNLAKLLGGTIWVESEPGKGSTFFFALPPKY